MAEIKKYPTKPFECWDKAKELRMDIYRRIAQAKEKGWIVASGGTEALIAVPAGLGDDYIPFGGEPYGASTAALGLSEKFMEGCEAKGYARDLCGYCRNYLGSVFLNQYAFGGPYPEPTFYYQLHACDTHGKWYQPVAEYTKRPYFAIDGGNLYRWPQWKESEKRRKNKLDYMAAQIHDSIEWMEKVTGREYDDEKLINAVHNEMVSTSLWAKCCELNKNIPAVMDLKTLYSFYVVAVLRRHTKEAVEFYHMLYDELKERAAQGIAAIANERYRMLHDSQPPWHALRMYRYIETFGIVIVGSHYDYMLSGGWELYYEDGKPYVRAATPIPKEKLKTRDDAVRALAHWILEHHLILRFFRFPVIGRTDIPVALARDWKCDGVIIHLNRGCESLAMSQLEVRQALINAGLPVLTYEGNVADPREFDEARTLARIDAFMESQGLKRLVE